MKRVFDFVKENQTTDDGVDENFIVSKLGIPIERLKKILSKLKRKHLVAKRVYLRKRQWYCIKADRDHKIRIVRKGLRRGIPIYFDHPNYGTLRVFKYNKLTQWALAGKVKRKSLCRSFVITPTELHHMYLQALQFVTVTNFKQGEFVITKQPKQLEPKTDEQLKAEAKELRAELRKKKKAANKERRIIVREMYRQLRDLMRSDLREQRRADRIIVKEMYRLFKEVARGEKKTTRKQKVDEAKAERKTTKGKGGTSKKKAIKGRKTSTHKTKEKGNSKITKREKGN